MDLFQEFRDKTVIDQLKDISLNFVFKHLLWLHRGSPKYGTPVIYNGPNVDESNSSYFLVVLQVRNEVEEWR